MGGVRNFRRRAGGCLLFLLLTLALLVSAVEIVGRGDFGDSVNLFVLRAHTRIVGWDPDHRNKPGQRPDINEDGLRTFMKPADIPDESFDVVFLGDSFVFGVMLRPSQAMPSQLDLLMRENLRLDVNVLNLGWLSSSPILSYRLLTEVGHEYRPDLVVLGLDMTDFRDDLVYRNPAYPALSARDRG